MKKFISKVFKRLNKTPVNQWAFLFEWILVSQWNKFFSVRPSSKPFLSGDTYLEVSSRKYLGEKGFKINPGDIVFCGITKLLEFQEKVLIKNISPFVLITHHGDDLVDEKYIEVINHPYLIHWYAQNSILKYPKITTIPIGLEDAWRHNNGIVSDFKRLRKKQVPKKPHILYGFNPITNLRVRPYVLEIMKKSKVTHEVKSLSREYRKELNRAMFVASPEGNGIDCHRTWEALYLRTIPIVVGEFYSNFPGFPGLVLEKWDDILQLTEEELVLIYEERILMLEKYDCIWHSYWMDKIRAKALCCNSFHKHISEEA